MNEVFLAATSAVITEFGSFPPVLCLRGTGIECKFWKQRFEVSFTNGKVLTLVFEFQTNLFISTSQTEQVKLYSEVERSESNENVQYDGTVERCL